MNDYTPRDLGLKQIGRIQINGATGQNTQVQEYSAQVLKQLITTKFKQNIIYSSEKEYDAVKVCFQLDLQIRQISNQIFKIWHKMSRVIYLDPKCI